MSRRREIERLREECGALARANISLAQEVNRAPLREVLYKVIVGLDLDAYITQTDDADWQEVHTDAFWRDLNAAIELREEVAEAEERIAAATRLASSLTHIEVVDVSTLLGGETPPPDDCFVCGEGDHS